ncbi:Phosphopantetheinyl transferase [Rhodospirillales bacterium URHD0017]|nr:Phosphopantetheinyl transferase [Rhodospirillales bacterium URHD0017]
MLDIETQPLDAFWGSLGGPSNDECHLALVDISRPTRHSGLAEGAWRDVLCGAERTRLDAFKSAAAAWEYEASHVALRLILERCLKIPASKIQFRRPGVPFQAPELVDIGSHAIKASLSHSGRFAAIATSRSSAVGADVEPLSRAKDAYEVVHMFLCDEELACLAEMSTGRRMAAALRAWCMKEAVLKAAGAGFQIDPTTIWLNIKHPGVPQLTSIKAPAGDLALSVCSAVVPTRPEALVALAVEPTIRSIQVSCLSLEELVAAASLTRTCWQDRRSAREQG